MTRYSNLLDHVDRRLERDIEREPSYSPGKPERRGSYGRYRFMTGWTCEPCGGEGVCMCDDKGAA